MRRNLSYYALVLCMGLDVGLGGPVRESLQGQLGVGMELMGLTFLAGCIGGTLGTLAGGRIFDRVRAHPVMAAFQLLAAALLVLVPLVPWFWLLLGLVALKGFAAGLIGVGANTLLSWTYGEKSGPYINGLHFSFGLGAFLSPLLAAQLLPIPGGYRFAYWGLAAFALLSALSVFSLPAELRPGSTGDGRSPRTSATPIPYALVVSAALYLFFYVGAEIAFGGWVNTYAVARGLFDDVRAAYLTSGFWFSFTVGRLVSIPVATRLAPQQVIPAALGGSVAFLLLGMAVPGSGAVLWICAAGLGFCMAPVWPMGFTYAGGALKLSARANSFILLGDSVGGMVLPSAVGWAITAAGPGIMLFLILGSLALTFTAYLAISRFRMG